MLQSYHHTSSDNSTNVGIASPGRLHNPVVVIILSKNKDLLSCQADHLCANPIAVFLQHYILPVFDFIENLELKHFEDMDACER